MQRWLSRPVRPRHPLLRLLSLALTLVLGLMLLLAGFVLGAILLAGGCLWLALRQARKGRKNTTPAGGAVLEGEFVVIERGPSR
ncbi:MAG: hypothetical protein QJR11_06105 [Fulvimonas sp.]|nr:hypothetical protein [Fulvimonas sp.]